MKCAVPLVMMMLVATCGCMYLDTGPRQLPPANKFTPLQISIFPYRPGPEYKDLRLCIAPLNWDVYGLSMALWQGDNYTVAGLDVGLVNCAEEALHGVQACLLSAADNVNGVQIGLAASAAGGRMRGLQVSTIWNLCLLEEAKADGVQIALIGNTATELNGLQLSLWNNSGDARGAQISPILNRASTMRGFQFGLVNFSQQSEGVQLGLVNIIRDSYVPFLPFVNVHVSRKQAAEALTEAGTLGQVRDQTIGHNCACDSTMISRPFCSFVTLYPTSTND